MSTEDFFADLERQAVAILPAQPEPLEDWRIIGADPDPFARLEAFDAHLVKTRGFIGMSDYWRYDLDKFYKSRKPWALYKLGRGGGKSTTLRRVAVCEGLYTMRLVPPGQWWNWPFISASSQDAGRSILEIAVMLTTVGIKAAPKSDHGQPTIKLLDMRGNAIAFVALAGTIAAVSGPSCCGATVDEEAKLRDKAGHHVNPARELIVSLVETFRAREGIRAIRCSSPFNEEGSHETAVREGDTMVTHLGRIGQPFVEMARLGFLETAMWEEQAKRNHEMGARLRRYAAELGADSPAVPTWVANPSIGAVKSRIALEVVPETVMDGLTRCEWWLRENGCVLPTALPHVESSGGQLRGFASIYGAADPRTRERYHSARPRSSFARR